MSTKYRLKFGVFGIEDRLTFEQISALSYAHIFKGERHIELPKGLVENNTEWFEKIEENQVIPTHEYFYELHKMLTKASETIDAIIKMKKLRNERLNRDARYHADKAFHAGMKYLSYLLNPKGYEPDKEEYLSNTFNT